MAVPFVVWLAGDVMTGRGIDQISKQPSDPALFESYVVDARDYVALAEWKNGPIPRGVDGAYPWGDALSLLDERAPDARIVNLETSVTTQPHCWPNKPVHYRMHPDNVSVLTAARIDCCTLANNHVLDWGHAGLLETLSTLKRAGIAVAGAGRDAEEAWAPAVLKVGDGRVLVFAVGSATSGIPEDWRAVTGPGVAFLGELSDEAIERISVAVRRWRRRGDVVVLSIHWGGNWGYAVPDAQVAFAHGLIDRAGVDVVHGHSSHHPKALEMYHGRLILYGCGDLLNDYEGISGHDQYRPGLSYLYLASIDASGTVAKLELVPMSTRRFRLQSATMEEAHSMFDTAGEHGVWRDALAVLSPNGTIEVRPK